MIDNDVVGRGVDCKLALTMRLARQSGLCQHESIPERPDRIAFLELFARVMAARAAHCGVTVSVPLGRAEGDIELLQELTESWAAAIEFVDESDERLAAAIHSGQTERVRYAHPDRIPDVVRRAAAEVGLYLAAAPVLAVGRVELLHYLREQSLCVDYHRYGNLGSRVGELRATVL